MTTESIIAAMIILASMMPAGSSFQTDVKNGVEFYNTCKQAETVKDKNLSHTWAITNKRCKLSNGRVIDKGTYIKVLRNDSNKSYYVIEWYSDTAKLSKSNTEEAFEVTAAQETKILMRKTAGVITA